MQAVSLALRSQQYLLAATKILSLGLIIFVNGFFFFPEISGVKTTFYILVLLPGLILLLAELKKFPFKNKHFLIFIALPIYLCLSHLWANDEHITRGFPFFIKQVLFIFILVFAFWSAIKVNKNFITTLLICMTVTGTIFSFISIVHYLFTNEGNFDSYLMGFSTNDSNKAGAFFTIHLIVCTYFLLFNGSLHKSVSAILLLILAITLDIILIVLTQTKATWLIIPFIPIFFMSHRISRIKRVAALFASSLLIVICAWYSEIFYSLTNLASVKNRIVILEETFAQLNSIGDYIYGIGLTYKLRVPQTIHPHNVFVDTLRFGGVIGLALFIGQIWVVTRIYRLNKSIPHLNCIILWYFSGIVLLFLYGQQPLTRPGYIWMLYWIPAAMVLSVHLLKQNKQPVFFENNKEQMPGSGEYQKKQSKDSNSSDTTY